MINKVQHMVQLALPIALGVFGAVSYSLAQDNHYWSNNYGGRSSLMGGAVVGGVSDPSAILYNPGALPRVQDNVLSVSANAAQYQNVEGKDAAGPGLSLDSDSFDVVPLLVAGIHRFEGLPEHTFGLAVASRSQFDFSGSARNEGRFDPVKNTTLFGLPIFEGQEDYVGQTTFDTDLQEIWAAASWGYAPAEGWGVGLSNIFAVRQQQQLSRSSSRAINVNSLQAAQSDIFSNVDYYNVRLFWRAGLHYTHGDFTFGLTGTSPSVHLTGDGSVDRELTVSGLDLNESGFPVTVIGNDRQEDLSAVWKSPASVAAGFSYNVTPETTLGFATEWFGGVGEYGIIRPEAGEFVRPAELADAIGIPGSDVFLRTAGAADSVVNYAVGVEHKIDDSTSGFFAFRTDFESAQPLPGLSVGLSDWDIYRFTVGVTTRDENSEFAIGLEYGFGSESRDGSPVSNIAAPQESELLFGANTGSKWSYDEYRVIFGYSYFFGGEKEKTT